MVTNNKKRTARQCAVLLTLLASASGCSTWKMMITPRSELWLERPWINKDWYYKHLDLDPVLTIPLGVGGPTLNVLKWWDMDVLEIPCRVIWPQDAVALYSRVPESLRPDVELSPQDIADIYTDDECGDYAVNACAWVLMDPTATFYLVGRLTWHGGRLRGPALYVECMTGEEVRAFALRGVKAGQVSEAASDAWRRYLRKIKAEEARKQSDNTQGTP